MNVGRRSILTAALVVLLAALPAVGYIQFRWLSEMSENQADRLTQTLQTANKQVRADLSDELSIISALFTVRTESGLEAGLEGFAESYRTWFERSRFPGLVKTVRVYHIREGRVDVREFDADDESFHAVQEPLEGEVEAFARQIADHVQGIGSLPIDSTVRIISPIGSVEAAAAGIAGRQVTTDLMGYLVAEVDRTYLTTVMLPVLVAEHVPLAGAGGDFIAAIVDPGEQTILYSTKEVQSSELFGGARRPIDDELMLAYRANVVLGERVPPGPEPPRGIDRNVVTVLRNPILQMWLGRLALEDGRSMVISGADSPVSIFPARSPKLGSEVDQHSRKLEVRPSLALLTWHQAGSIARGVAQSRHRNIGISAAVLVILAGAIVSLYGMLVRSLRLRDQEREFIASVTHELRTPIAAIHATSENLAHGVVSDDERVTEYGALLLEEGKRLRTMVEHVLLFAGLNAATHTLRTEPLEIGPLIDRVVARVPEVDPERLSIDVDDRLPPVHADRVAIESLVSNLVSNAFKHNGPGTEVLVSATQRSSAGSPSVLVLTVTDTGRGIPKSERSRVTEPFFRGSWSTSRQVPGSGLGLSLCVRIATLHHGKLAVVSPAHDGTSIVVTIPFEDQREQK